MSGPRAWDELEGSRDCAGRGALELGPEELHTCRAVSGSGHSVASWEGRAGPFQGGLQGFSGSSDVITPSSPLSFQLEPNHLCFASFPQSSCTFITSEHRPCSG